MRYFSRELAINHAAFGGTVMRLIRLADLQRTAQSLAVAKLAYELLRARDRPIRSRVWNLWTGQCRVNVGRQSMGGKTRVRTSRSCFDDIIKNGLQLHASGRIVLGQKIYKYSSKD